MRDGQKTLRARQLRSNMTDAEQALWKQLRSRQLARHRFRRQCPIGPYIVDFACLAASVVVEVDGGQHAGADSDVERDAFLRRRGFLVLRFWNDDVLQNMTAVVETIMQHFAPARPHPGLPPQAGEGERRRVAPGKRERGHERPGTADRAIGRSRT